MFTDVFTSPQECWPGFTVYFQIRLLIVLNNQCQGLDLNGFIVS